MLGLYTSGRKEVCDCLLVSARYGEAVSFFSSIYSLLTLLDATFPGLQFTSAGPGRIMVLSTTEGRIGAVDVGDPDDMIAAVNELLGTYEIERKYMEDLAKKATP